MNKYTGIIAAAMLVGTGVFFLSTGENAEAGEGLTRAAMISTLPAFNDEGADYSYVGSKKCKKCHMKQYKSWAKTKMGNALDILKPGNAAEAKKKFNIDVDKDFTTDENCLKCHTVGFGSPGGYTTPDPGDKKAVRKAKSLANVGCESCHGPGSAYIKVHKDIMMSKRKYKVEELYAVGLRKVDQATCLTCHNENSPTISAGATFDYEKKKQEGTHEHFPLKQRED